jgi:hypothetical protein
LLDPCPFGGTGRLAAARSCWAADGVLGAAGIADVAGIVGRALSGDAGLGGSTGAGRGAWDIASTEVGGGGATEPGCDGRAPSRRGRPPWCERP